MKSTSKRFTTPAVFNKPAKVDEAGIIQIDCAGIVEAIQRFIIDHIDHPCNVASACNLGTIRGQLVRISVHTKHDDDTGTWQLSKTYGKLINYAAVPLKPLAKKKGKA